MFLWNFMCNITQSSWVNSFHRGAGFISWGYSPKGPQTRWLQTTEISFTAWKLLLLLGNQRHAIWMWAVDSCCGVIWSLLSSSSWWSDHAWCSLAVDPSPQSLRPSPHGVLPVCWVILGLSSVWAIAYSNNLILIWLNLQRPYFQIRLHWQVLELEYFGLHFGVGVEHHSSRNRWENSTQLSIQRESILPLGCFILYHRWIKTGVVPIMLPFFLHYKLQKEWYYYGCYLGESRIFFCIFLNGCGTMN